MQWRASENDERIAKACGQRHQAECALTWDWPRDVEYVYLYAFKPGEERRPEQLARQQLKLITREEYKTAVGYHQRIEHIGVQMYRVFPCVQENGMLVGLLQQDDRNLIRISGIRAQIRYKVKYGRTWFRKRKPVTLELFSEMAVPGCTLCYVKKQGEEPLGRDDGVVYPLLRDIAAGRQSLPAFEIRKDEFVRVFLTDGKMYSEMYELIRE